MITIKALLLVVKNTNKQIIILIIVISIKTKIIVISIFSIIEHLYL